ncbi:MAG: dihydrolipoyl dehydrogenase [Thermoanaerobaculia bacterium]|nr:dihydrolipoyl dehydrogenase [Thermoanaerobaculia bacterium]
MGSRERFDLAVVGAGPGGYVAALRAAQLGSRVAVVEAEAAGGVCLNWGCIPSKALLTGAGLVEDLRRHGDTFGIGTGTLTLDYGKAIDHSRKTADRLCKGVQGLFKKNQIELVAGRGRLAARDAIEVTGAAPRTVEADHLILATGSAEWVPPGLEVDGERVLTSREALESKHVPERLVIIGAGAVGLEFAYVYAMYGSQVTVVEMMDQVLPGADADVAQAVQREYRRKGIDVRLGTKFLGCEPDGDGLSVTLEGPKGSEALPAGQLLAAIGRRPRSDDLGLEKVGVELDEKGFVGVDEGHRTSVSSILAIGDLAGGPLLAHKASEEGVSAAEHLAGQGGHPLDPRRIPSCIYCQPQVAWLVLGEAEARAQFGDDLRVGKFPFTASGKAIAAGHTAGFAKILAEPRHVAIVGAHLVGAGATELIAEIGVALTLEATTEEIAATCHAHPTLSEALLEAALDAEGRAINF